MFFRGLLFRLLRRTQPLWLAMLVSSGLFAVQHLNTSTPPLQLVDVGVATFLSGCLFAVAYASTGSLSTAILAHTLVDLVPSIGLIAGPFPGQMAGLAVFIAGYAAITFVGILPTMRRWRTRWPVQSAYIAGPLADARALWAIATAWPTADRGLPKP